MSSALPGATIEEYFLFMPFNAQVRDPIYGYIDYVKELEGPVIDSWVLQRLRYIYQLQTAHFVYPGATHTRFSHSLGVMDSSSRYISFLIRTSVASMTLSEDLRKTTISKQREIIFATRLLGLLHDIGHGPFSHAFDKYVLSRRDFLNYVVGNHEVLGYIIYRDYLRDLIESKLLENQSTLRLDPEFVLDILDKGMMPPRGMYRFTDLTSRGLIRSDEFYDVDKYRGLEVIARMIVRDYIYTSDIMDYLKRDSYFTGVPIGQVNDEWIMRNSYIVEKDSKPTIAVTAKTLDEIARLLDARKMMYKHVYLHPVNVAFIETIGRLLPCIKSRITSTVERVLEGDNKLVNYLALTDSSLYSELQRLLVEGPSSYECEDKTTATIALESLFYKRKPMWKLVKRFTYDLYEARVLFSGIGVKVQEIVKSAIKSEVASALSSSGVSEQDVEVYIDKVEVYPTAGGEIASSMEVIEVKDGRVVHGKSYSFEDFAKEYGLIPEALISVYINREKYRKLDESSLNKVIEISENVIESSIKLRKREAPETS
ncbi:MAG: HD domain-containing protein [Desulfurococcaceae archaeon]|nr:HD domain-containing protein [Desulfurococcaceae archaeon]